MRNPFRNYETKITLLLLILTVLLGGSNLVNLQLLKSAHNRLDLELSQTLEFVARTAMDYVERGETRQDELEKLLIREGVNKVFAVDPQTRLLFSAPPILDPVSEKIWTGFSRGDKARLWAGTPLFSSLYQGENGTYKAFGLPFGRGSVKNVLFVEGEAGFLAVLQRAYKAGSIFSVSIFLLSAILGAFYLRTVVEPYRRISKRASDIYVDSERSGEVEFAVESFERIIRDLKKKEGMLERLYSRSRRRADNLERFTKHILDGIPTGVLSFDTRDRLTYSNEASRQVLSDIPRKIFQPLVRDALKRGKTYLSKELEFRDGRCLGVSTSILKDKKGETSGVAVLFRDITEMKRLEREISFKEKMAALGEMSAGIAHEFRNSLASILGYGKLLRRRVQDSSQTSYIESLIDECMSMESTIRRFLDFSRPEEMEVEEFDLTSMLKDTLQHFSEQVGRMGVSLEVSVPDGAIMVSGDPQLLKRAILNVVQNAIEATPEAGKVNISLSSMKKGLRIVVKDEGVGIDSETRDQIFTPFFTTKKSGTGLGLSIVQKVVAAHKGSISIESEVGRGTTVSLDLPRLLPLSHSCVTRR